MTDELTERVARAIEEASDGRIFGGYANIAARAAIEAFEAARQPTPVFPQLAPKSAATVETKSFFGRVKDPCPDCVKGECTMNCSGTEPADPTGDKGTLTICHNKNGTVTVTARSPGAYAESIVTIPAKDWSVLARAAIEAYEAAHTITMMIKLCPHGNVVCTSPDRCSKSEQCLGGDYDAIARGNITEEWKCSGCGIESPNQLRSCDCITNVLFRSGNRHVWKLDATEVEAISKAIRLLEEQGYMVEAPNDR